MNKKQLFKIVEDLMVNPNGCKYLQSRNRRAYWFYFRNRPNKDQQQYYYLVSLKGNYIRGYRIKWLLGDKAINIFMDFGIPILIGSKPAMLANMPTKHKVLLAKEPFRLYKSFCDTFRLCTPELGWDNDAFTRRMGRTKIY